ncbi:MAG: type II toxin-antitoxin system Phd/YefM family antitoxin [Terriglobales bacterium]
MTTVGVRELKAKLSEYLRKVQAGEAVQITDRGKAVAEIVPAGWAASSQVSPELAEAIRRGEVTPPSKPGPIELKPIVKMPEGFVQKLLDEMREDRV